MPGHDELYERLKALQNNFYGNGPPIPIPEPSDSSSETEEEEDPLPPDIQERLNKLRSQPTEEMSTDDEEIPDEPDPLTSS